MRIACQPGEFCLIADETLADGFGRCVAEEGSRGEGGGEGGDGGNHRGSTICGGPANIACRPNQLCLWDTEEMDSEWGRCYEVSAWSGAKNGDKKLRRSGGGAAALNLDCVNDQPPCPIGPLLPPPGLLSRPCNDCSSCPFGGPCNDCCRGVGSIDGPPSSSCNDCSACVIDGPCTNCCAAGEE